MTVATTAPPGKGWQLIARTKVVVGNASYPAGSQIPISDIKPANLRALLNQNVVMWEAPSKADSRPLPTPIPPSLPALPLPSEPTIHNDTGDVVTDWMATLDAAIRLHNGQSSRAVDWLWTNEAARSQYKLAQAEMCNRVANQVRKSGRSVVSVGPTDPRARLLP
jgi:hypothetical protein